MKNKEEYFWFENIIDYKKSILSYAEKNDIITENKDILNVLEEVRLHLSNIFLNSKLYQYEPNNEDKNEGFALFQRLNKIDLSKNDLKIWWTSEENFQNFLGTQSYKWRELLWRKYFEAKYWKYNKKYDLLVKRWLIKEEADIYSFKYTLLKFELETLIEILIKNLFLDSIQLKNLFLINENIINFILFDLKISINWFLNILKSWDIIKNLDIEKLKFINILIWINSIDDIFKNWKILAKNNKKISQKNIENNIKKIKEKDRNITNENLINIIFILNFNEEEFKKYLEYITKENIEKYWYNLSYLIKNSLFLAKKSKKNNIDIFNIKKTKFNFSNKETSRFEACKIFEQDTIYHFENLSKNIILVKIWNETIGHIKNESGEKTFLSYENLEDKNWNIILLKWWIYDLDIREISWYNSKNKNWFEIIKINKKNSNKIKIKFLRLISSNFYDKADNPNDIKKNKRNIWEDFENFKKNIHWKIN